MEQKKISFVPFLRSDLDDLHTGKLTRSEYDLYSYLRHGSDPYATAKVSLEGLSADFAHRGWKKNTINKLLLSLNEKRYIHYDKRVGRRGTFEIHFAGIKMPNGAVSILPATINDSRKSNGSKDSNHQSEGSQTLLPSNQSFGDLEVRKQALITKFSVSEIRGSHNDHDHEKKKERSSPLKRNTLVSDFVPTSHEQARCKEMAIVVNERTMDFLLGTLHDHGIEIIEQGWREYDRISNKASIKNSAAYLNSIIQELIRARDKPP